jgi:dihydrofolate reductase
MGKIVLMLSLSLDGFFEGPNREIDWHLVDHELHTDFNAYLRTVGAFLEGRVTHELMADFWPTADEDPSNSPTVREYAGIWREKPKFVFSRTIERADWNTTVLPDVVPDQIEDLKERYGELSLGGADLAATFMRLDLIDEYRLYIHPVVVGAGKRLFPPGLNVSLQLAETKSFGNGVVLLHYERA